MPADRSPQRGPRSAGTSKSTSSRPRTGGAASRSAGSGRRASGSGRSSGSSSDRPGSGRGPKPTSGGSKRPSRPGARPANGPRTPAGRSSSRPRRDDERDDRDDRRRSDPRPTDAKRSRSRRDDGRGTGGSRPSGARSSDARSRRDDDRDGRRPSTRGRGASAQRARDEGPGPPPDTVPNIPGQGAITRRGAAWLKRVDQLDKAGIKPRNTPGAAAEAWRKASGLEDEAPPPRKKPAKKAGFAERLLGDDDDLVMIDEPEQLRDAASGAVTRGSKQTRRRAPAITVDDHDDENSIEREVQAELAQLVPKRQLGRFENRLGDASRAFRRERFADAARILKRLTDDAPGAPSVRELYGLTLYRQGKWRAAAKELEAFRLLSGSTEQHPVLADCYRALGQWDAVDELWTELKAASPAADLMVEGRIVTAGARADRGDVGAGIELLEQGWKPPKRPKEHHLRRAYALADLYERGGDVTRARQLFEWVARYDDDFADAARRARQVGG